MIEFSALHRYPVNPSILDELSLALIGNASRQTFEAGGDLDPRRFR
jgi:hypothetical protein